MCSADERITNNCRVAVTITKDVRMETKEGNEGRGFHIPGRKTTRNLKKCYLLTICMVKLKKNKT
jgi:hypothetical protein